MYHSGLYRFYNPLSYIIYAIVYSSLKNQFAIPDNGNKIELFSLISINTLAFVFCAIPEKRITAILNCYEVKLCSLCQS